MMLSHENRGSSSQTVPVWNYEDLILFVGAVLPAFAIALLVVRPFHFSNEGLRQIVFQLVLYVLLVIVLYFLIAGRYHHPFWRSLGWNFDFRGVWLCIVAGPVLAVTIATMSAFVRAPANPSVQNLISDRVSMIAVIIFGSLAGPLFEEIVFRGFVQPLLTRSVGAALAIVLTGIPFALLHGPGFQWAWQSVGLVGVAGLVLGYVRYRTNSTVASALVHVGYNSTFFVGFLITRST
jgi:membrane protease YdiL (CAAX protease family)